MKNKSNKILAAVLAGVLASCSDTKTESAATAPQAMKVTALNVVKMNGKTAWADLVAEKTLPSDSLAFDVSAAGATVAQYDSVASGFSGALGALKTTAYKAATDVTDFSKSVIVMSAATTTPAVAPDALTLSASDTANDLNLQGFSMTQGNTVTIAGTAGKTVALGLLNAAGTAAGGANVTITTAGTLNLDTASLTNATVSATGAAIIAFAPYTGGATNLSTSTTSLGDNAVIASATAIAIPAKYTVIQTSDSASVTATAITNTGTHTLTKGTVAASTYTNTGTLNQAGGAITAAFTNGQAAGADATANPAVPGTHTMTGGTVTGAYLNLAGSVNLSGGAKIDGAFTNNDQLTIAADVSTTTGGTTTVTSAATITGVVTNTSALNINGGVLADALTSTGTSTTATAAVVMSGGTVTGAVANNAYSTFTMSGGTLASTLTSTGTSATATAAVAMSGGTVTGAVANNAYSTFTMSGGTLASTLTNIANGTFTISGASATTAASGTTAAITATTITGVTTNTGTFIVKGGLLGDFTNGENGVFTFDSTDNAIVGAVNVAAGKVSTFNFTTGKTLTTKAVTLDAATVINVTLGDKGGLAAGDTTTTPVALISSTGAIDLKTVVLNLKANNKQPIAAGTKFQLVNAGTLTNPSAAVTVDTSLTVNNLAATPTKIAISDFTITNAANVLTLTVTNGLAAQPASTAKSAIVAGGFRSHATAPKATKIAGTSFAFVNDAALSNGSFDGTFALQSASTFAGFDLTHSVASTSKALTQSSFNDASFMTIVSKDLGSNGFTFAPSVALGVVQAFGVNASAELNNDTFFVKDASNSSLIAELGFTSSTSFKLNGVEFAASAAASVASKSGDQTFNMTNRDGDMMVGQAAKHNVALNLGLSAKIDATTSFYATAKSESYNNSKAFQVGVKF